MPIEEKMQIGIYKIETDAGAISDQITSLDIISDELKRQHFRVQELQKTSLDGFKLALFYKNVPINPRWKSFLTGVAKANQEILKEDNSRTESFVLILEKDDTKNLYAVTGGLHGYFGIQDFISEDFGVDILSRLIKKDEKVLKSVKEKSVIGGILGSTKFFRKTYNLFENDGFGKIYQELQAKLDKKVLTSHFGFSKEELKEESVCVAKSSFAIHKSISFPRLLEIINGCEFVIEKLKPIAINSVKKIAKKKNKKLIEELGIELLNQLWLRFQNEDYEIDFDLCHKDFEKYLTASKFVVKKNSSEANFFDDHFIVLDSIDFLFKKIRSLKKKPTTKSEFAELMSSFKIFSYDEEDKELTKGWLIAHLFGDIPLNKKRYFLIDNNWYEVENSFIEDLNFSCESFVKEKLEENLLEKKWSLKDDENTYNQSYIGESQTLVLDKVTPENIEPCDILRWDDKNLYFCHVKKGFVNTMRDLCSQIFISASRLHDSTSSKEYVDKIYDQLKNKKTSPDPYFKKIGAQVDLISKDEFRKIFELNKVFVLAILDSNATERSLKIPMKGFGSNIAKFSLQDLAKAMRGIAAEFRIAQIQRK